MRVEAIVLAGGRATRMGGVDKPAIRVGATAMLTTALAAVGGCARRIVVGPYRADLDPDIEQIREDPPGSGPVSAIVAGSALLDRETDFVVVLAADLPFLRAGAVDELIRRCAETDCAAACAVDADGRAQYLVAVWRRAELVARLDALGDPADLPVKALIPDDVLLVALDGIADCDTEDDLRNATATLAYGTSDALALDAARTALRDSVSRLPVRRLPVRDAAGAASAEPMHAADAVPRFDASAMDGYAVAGDGPWQVLADTGIAGRIDLPPLIDGTALRIATGARLPGGTSRVLRDEFVERTGDRLLARRDAPDRDDTRRRGEDWRAGDLLAPSAAPIGVALISLAASTGVVDVAARGPVRAQVLISGDEICAGEPSTVGQTRDALGPVLGQFLAQCAIRCDGITQLPDTAAGFDETFTTATDTDVLIVVGATGGGAADQLRDALRRAGARVVVPRLRLRPGGSTVVAELPDGRVVFGLPGNPYAAVAVLLALAPALVDGLIDRAPRPASMGLLVNAGELSGGPATRIVPARAGTDGSLVGDTSVRTAHLGGMLGRDALCVVPPDATDGAIVELIRLPG